MKELILSGKRLRYKIVRFKKKNISIKLEDKNSLIIRVPNNVSEDEIFNIIHKNGDKIIKKISILENFHNDNKELIYIQNEKVLYLGNEYLLKVNEVDSSFKNKVSIENSTIHIYLNRVDSCSIKSLLIKWYKEEALKIIGNRTVLLSKELKLFPSRIIIKEQKSRWGSCNSKGEIRINWKLIMAPLNVIDYVIIHELCHIKYMNHSKEYWSFVESIISDYKKNKRWLNENGMKLMGKIK